MVPFVIGHRGAAGLAPENTLASFRRARAEGAQWVEFDVMLSRDAIPLIFHDNSVNRTTSGRGAVAKLDYETIRPLDAGSWFGNDFEGEAVPTFNDLIAELALLGLGANVEIKPTPGMGGETSRIACQMILDNWPAVLPPPVISSFDRAAMEVARDMVPDIERAMLFSRLPRKWLSIVKELDCQALHISDKSATKAVVGDIRAHGYPVRVYTVNDPVRAEELRNMGVSSVFTDRPDLIKD